GAGSGSDRPVRRLIGAPTAPPLPCCAVPDRGLPPRAARGRAKPPRRSTPAAGRRFKAAQATSHSSRTSSRRGNEATKAHRLLALGVPATDVRHAREAEERSGEAGAPSECL